MDGARTGFGDALRSARGPSPCARPSRSPCWPPATRWCSAASGVWTPGSGGRIVSEVRDVGAVLVGDELVLSTGIAMAASPAAADDFVRQLVEVGAAGLVVELSTAYPRCRSRRCVGRAADFPWWCSTARSGSSR